MRKAGTGTRMIATFVLTAAHTAGAAGEIASVFGLQLGMPLSAPACQEGGRTNYHTLCYLDDKVGVSPVHGQFQLVFPVDEKPDWLWKLFAKVDANDSRVEQLYLELHDSPDAEQAAEAAFRTKFGRPHSKERLVYQNALGATFASYLVEWSASGLAISLRTARAPNERGSIVVTTGQFAERAAQREAARRQSARPL